MMSSLAARLRRHRLPRVQGNHARLARVALARRRKYQPSLQMQVPYLQLFYLYTMPEDISKCISYTGLPQSLYEHCLILAVHALAEHEHRRGVCAPFSEECQEYMYWR